MNDIFLFSCMILHTSFTDRGDRSPLTFQLSTPVSHVTESRECDPPPEYTTTGQHHQNTPPPDNTTRISIITKRKMPQWDYGTYSHILLYRMAKILHFSASITRDPPPPTFRTERRSRNTWQAETATSITASQTDCIVMYLQPVLNPKSYDGPAN